MKRSNAGMMIICTLIIALFVYAASAKLLDYYQFQFGLSESPFIAPFASVLAWLVPVTELIIAVMLVIPAWRLAGLYATFVLMLLFTIYIAALLLLSTDIPCSCGGILSAMPWGVHILFNLMYVGLAAYGIYSIKRRKRRTYHLLASWA